MKTPQIEAMADGIVPAMLRMASVTTSRPAPFRSPQPTPKQLKRDSTHIRKTK
jgi:hypothetical protein